MTHDEAIKDGATERYVLDEMTDEERDVFEEHYFDCAVCAEDVKAAIAVRDGLAAERVATTPMVVPFQPRRRSMPTWLGAAAAALVAVFSMYAAVVRPQRKQLADASAMVAVALQPKGAAIYPLRAVRGERTEIARSGVSVLQLEIPTDIRQASGNVTCLVIDSKGQPQGKPFSVSIKPDDSGPFVGIEGSTLPPGDYAIRVDGLTQPVAPYTFRVR
jgi:hypothetical protein